MNGDANASLSADPNLNVPARSGELNASSDRTATVARLRRMLQNRGAVLSFQPPAGGQGGTPGPRMDSSTGHPSIEGTSAGEHSSAGDPRSRPGGRHLSGDSYSCTGGHSSAAETLAIDSSGEERVCAGADMFAQGYPSVPGRSPLDGRPVWSTGHPALDAALPHHGLPIGTMVEILYRESGAGAMRLAMGIALKEGSEGVRESGSEGREEGSSFSKGDNFSDLQYRFASLETENEKIGRSFFFFPHSLTPSLPYSLPHTPLQKGNKGVRESGSQGREDSESLSSCSSHNSTATRPEKVGVQKTAPPSSFFPHSLTPSLPYSLSSLIVLIDSSGDFYPPAAFALGVDPRRLLIVRPRNLRDAIWATDQCLRSSAVGVVVAALPRLDPAMSRRLQLAARSNRTLGLILRPARGCQKTFAAVRMLIEGRESGHQVTLIKVREGTPAPDPIPIQLYSEAGDETIPVPVPSVSADRAADAARSRRGDIAEDGRSDIVRQRVSA